MDGRKGSSRGTPRWESRLGKLSLKAMWKVGLENSLTRSREESSGVTEAIRARDGGGWMEVAAEEVKRGPERRNHKEANLAGLWGELQEGNKEDPVSWGVEGCCYH